MTGKDPNLNSAESQILRDALLASAAENSPLLEADPDSTSELFAIDPLKLTDQNINAQVRIYRAARLKFMQEQSTVKPKRRAGTGAGAKAPLELEL